MCIYIYVYIKAIATLSFLLTVGVRPTIRLRQHWAAKHCFCFWLPLFFAASSVSALLFTVECCSVSVLQNEQVI